MQKISAAYKAYIIMLQCRPPTQMITFRHIRVAKCTADYSAIC